MLWGRSFGPKLVGMEKCLAKHDEFVSRQPAEFKTQSKSNGESLRCPESPDAHLIEPAALKEAIVDRHVGSFLNTYDVAFSAERWQQLITQIQDVATKETRQKIPILYGIDSVHGAN